MEPCARREGGNTHTHTHTQGITALNGASVLMSVHRTGHVERIVVKSFISSSQWMNVSGSR